MNSFLLVVTLLPVVFMFHDFEEIIFMKSWFNKNGQWLAEKFPFLPKTLFSHLENTTTANFALMVAEEFILVCLVTYLGILSGNYYWWLGAFMAFSVHIVIHLIQWIVVRGYIPVIVTSLLCLPYCIYGIVQILHTNEFTGIEIAACTLIGMVLTALNLLLIHRIFSRL